ncbi:hypothetical protein [Spirosoma panaciterrae]|uniref:hypothetical protein n=1 Tax=Spirosoma panaciterrae TaxID=496058 RepID=UPI0003747DD4|nr:hypothetical protein [Spirosoma panaciterrae]
MEVTVSTKLSEGDLVEAPFWLAEHLMMKVNDQPDSQPIQVLGQQIRAFYRGNVQTENGMRWEVISPNLNAGLAMFHQKVRYLVPAMKIDDEDRWVLSFPAYVLIDWNRLVNYFMGVSEAIQSLIGDCLPDGLVNEYIRVQFVQTAWQVAEAGVEYEETIVRQALERLLTCIRYDAKRVRESYWKHYHCLPLETALLQLKAITSSLRFRADEAQSEGIPPDEMERLKGWVDDADYAKIMQKWLSKHELKEKELSDHLAFQAHQVEQSDRLHTAQEVSMRINIDDNQIEPLLKAFQPYLNELDQVSLKALLDGQTIAQRITVRDRPQNSIAYVFRQAKENGHIQNEKTEIAAWLVRWFQVVRQGESYPLNHRSVYDTLTQEYATPKTKPIRYKP